jgi:hypothetical protein
MNMQSSPIQTICSRRPDRRTGKPRARYLAGAILAVLAALPGQSQTFSVLASFSGVGAQSNPQVVTHDGRQVGLKRSTFSGFNGGNSQIPLFI